VPNRKDKVGIGKPLVRERGQTGIGFVLILGLLVGELLAISFRYDALGLLEATHVSWAQWLAYGGYAFKVAIVFVVAVLLSVGPRLTHYYQDAVDNARGRSFVPLLVSQLTAYGLFFFTTHLIFGNPGVDKQVEGFVPLLWLVLLPTVFVLWIMLLSPMSYWVRFVQQEKTSIALACVVSVSTLAVAIYSQQLWSPLSEVTFQTSAWLLGLFYSQIVADPQQFLLGTPDFLVRISAVCSGYEGIGLVTVFTALFLSVFRRDFKFPQALLLFPIGIVAIWCFNAIRIVLLIIIGEEISPRIAVGGFHSQAGWISFILVSVGLLVFSYNLKFFTHGDHGESKSLGINTPVALLLPLVVLLSMTLLTSALSADIDWLYPARVIATGGVLIALWHHYRLTPYILAWTPVLAGGAVFLVWLVLVPDNPDRSVLVGNELSQLSGGAVVLWLTFRVIGSVITVPLAEELAFRGYILGRLSKSTFKIGEKIRFSWVAWLVSSLLFGLMHSAWIAGMIAGLVYGLVRYQRNKISDAIVAHAVTNLMLSGYVILTGTWSLW